MSVILRVLLLSELACFMYLTVTWLISDYRSIIPRYRKAVIPSISDKRRVIWAHVGARDDWAIPLRQHTRTVHHTFIDGFLTTKSIFIGYIRWANPKFCTNSYNGRAMQVQQIHGVYLSIRRNINAMPRKLLRYKKPKSFLEGSYPLYRLRWTAKFLFDAFYPIWLICFTTKSPACYPFFGTRRILLYTFFQKTIDSSGIILPRRLSALRAFPCLYGFPRPTS